ncbi:MAG TPA: hypothetical protein VK979_09565 [Guyparkeria sp.]|nr:hypothetical protein [Guyparkeria sp.]
MSKQHSHFRQPGGDLEQLEIPDSLIMGAPSTGKSIVLLGPLHRLIYEDFQRRQQGQALDDD